MSLKKILPLFLISVALILAIYFYPHSPSTMVTHWGFYGELNGYSSKFFALFFMPILSVFLYLLFRFLPQTDPYQSNFKEFEKYFDIFIKYFFCFSTLFIYFDSRLESRFSLQLNPVFNSCLCSPFLLYRCLTFCRQEKFLCWHSQPLDHEL